MSTSKRATPGKPNRISTRCAELQTSGIELTDLTNTNPTQCGLFDPRILEVISEYVPRASIYQPTPRGPWPARAALAERYGGDPDDYWLTASTSEAYGWLFTMLADPGDGIAIPSPGYPLIEPLARLHSLTTHPYHSFYLRPTGWEVDLDSLRVTFDKSVQAVVAVHPNNPTGGYCPETVPRLASERNLPVIADEVFYPYWLGDGEPPRRLSQIEGVTTFGLDGLSKLLAAPQLKLGWIRLSADISVRDGYARTLDNIADTYLSVNSPVALALPDLLDLADSVVASVTARLRANLSTLREIFGKERVRTTYGGWMVLLDIPPITDAEDLCLKLMDLAGLCVHPGYFYDLEDSTLALSLLPENHLFEESCRRLDAALAVLSENNQANSS